MRIRTSMYASTSLSKANNSCDTISDNNLCDFLNKQLKELNLKSSRDINTPIGKLNFTAYISNYAITGYRSDYKLEIRIVADYKSSETIQKIWDILEESDIWEEDIEHLCDELVSNINENLSLYIPYKESFKFESNKYWIEQDPTNSHKPKFNKFVISNDFDTNHIKRNLIVYI